AVVWVSRHGRAGAAAADNLPGRTRVDADATGTGLVGRAGVAAAAAMLRIGRNVDAGTAAVDVAAGAAQDADAVAAIGRAAVGSANRSAGAAVLRIAAEHDAGRAAVALPHRASRNAGAADARRIGGTDLAARAAVVRIGRLVGARAAAVGLVAGTV